MRDFESYYAAGAAWNAHKDAYSTQIWDFERTVPGVRASRAEILPFVGPPWTLPFWGLLGRLRVEMAQLVWGLALAAALLWFALQMSRVLGAWSLRGFVAVVCVLAGFGPLTSDLALGQAALLSFAGCVIAGAAWRTSRPAFWGAALASIQPNLAIALIATFRRRRTIVGIIAAAIALVTLAVVARVPGVVTYVELLRAHGATERFALIQMTPAAVFYGLGVAPAIAGLIGAGGSVAAITAIAITLCRKNFKPLWALGATFALLPFALPFFHEHDFVILLLPILLCLRFARGHAQIAAATGTILVSVDWLGLAQRPDGVLQTTLLSATVACGVILLGRLPASAALATASILLLIPIAGAAAAAHAAPVWPDAMRGTPLLLGDVSAIWHDELQRAGLFAVQPLWAGLRALTLLGSGLLAWCCYETAAIRSATENSAPRI